MMLAFLNDRRGGVAPLLALAALPIMGTVGAAIDYSRANSARAAMQAAADSTSLIIARNMSKQPAGDAIAEASAYFAASFHRADVQINLVGATPGAAGDKKTIEVSAQGSINTSVLRVMGVSAIPLNVTSSAASVFDGYGCVLALDKEANDTFLGQGSTNVALKGCSLYDNSKHNEAMTVGGSAKISARSVGVVGGITPGSYGLTADLGIATGILPIDDPYKNVEPPSPGGCTEQNYKTNVSVTLNPGVYCNGIAIHSGATVTLNPGIYYIDGGDLVVNGNAGLVGNGVTVVFTSKNKNSYGTAVFNGTATINLTAMTYGATAGIVLFGDRKMPKNTIFKLNGGATQSFGGAVYLPQAAIDFIGGNGSTAACTQLIGNKISFSGNSSLALSCNSYQTKPFGTWSIRITS
jgi:Flp pilus assembly protein TadG